MQKLLAIVWLRWKLLIRQAGSTSGIINLITGIMLFALGAIISLGLAAGFGIWIYLSAKTGEIFYLRIAWYIVFYSFFFFGVILPILITQRTIGFEPSRFIVFPISRRMLYGITLSSSFMGSEHLFYYPALIAVFLAGVIIRGDNLLVGGFVCFAFLLFNGAVGNTVLLILQNIMKRRRIREIVLIVSFMIIVALSFIPYGVELIQEKIKGEEIPLLSAFLSVAAKIGRFFPPSLAAEGLSSLHSSEIIRALTDVGWIFLWCAGVIAIGYYIFVRYHLDERGKSTRRRKEKRTLRTEKQLHDTFSLDTFASRFIPGEIIAVATKDLRYLSRSVILKFQFLMLPVLVIIVAFIFGRDVQNPHFGINPKDLVFYGMLIYITMFATNFLYNSFAWEGSGVKSYFISPLRLQKIILGKNLAVGVYAVVFLVLSMIIWGVIVGIPHPIVLLTGILIFSSTIMNHAIWGNFISIFFPAERDISSMRNNPSQTGIFMSFGGLIVSGGIIFLCLLIPYLYGFTLLQPFLLAIVLSAQVWLYAFCLKYAARLLESRKEKIVETLKSKT